MLPTMVGLNAIGRDRSAAIVRSATCSARRHSRQSTCESAAQDAVGGTVTQIKGAKGRRSISQVAMTIYGNGATISLGSRVTREIKSEISVNNFRVDPYGAHSMGNARAPRIDSGTFTGSKTRPRIRIL